jgi:protoporphyrinogen IX oxidase
MKICYNFVLMEAINIFKSLHIIFMVSWFAGLFYIVRLFVYFSETKNLKLDYKQILQKQYKIMQKRLWYIIAWPSMLLTLIFGVSMLFISPAYIKISYIQLKLIFVLILVIYHVLCHFIYLQQQKNIIRFSSNQLRIFNEMATLLLVTIVFIIVMKNSLSWIYGTIGFISISLLLFIGIRIYKKIRLKK